MTEHTKGPWSVEAYKDGETWGTYYIPECQEHVESLDDGSDEPQEQMRVEAANACLIAAAPEMLEALKQIFEHCAMVHKHWGENDNSKQAEAAIAGAREAIAKATGSDQHHGTTITELERTVADTVERVCPASWTGPAPSDQDAGGFGVVATEENEQ